MGSSIFFSTTGFYSTATFFYCTGFVDADGAFCTATSGLGGAAAFSDGYFLGAGADAFISINKASTIKESGR
jgi:hypothetical protein